jgi:hypothetical protein
MRRYLFLDNYRGFKDTSVPLADVNFLVGENSTGKTSILTLLRMFSSPQFFFGSEFIFGPDFGSETPQLGHFKELVSAHSEDRAYFRVGICEERNSDDEKKKSHLVTGMLFTYMENEGLPKLSQVTAAIGSREITLRYSGEDVLCRTHNGHSAATVEEMNSRIPRWVTEHKEEGEGWKKVELPKGIRGQFPLFMVLSFAAHAAKSETSSSQESVDYFSPPVGPPLVWIAPIRTEPRPIYHGARKAFSSDGSHTPWIIRRMLASPGEKPNFDDFMSHAGTESGLFDGIQTKCFGETNDPTAAFEVDVLMDGQPMNLSWVGYGVSQSLPILVELLDREKGSWFAIQQPEVHLHPRAQASLGDIFFKMALRESKSFLIETHSDFTIDRFRMNYRRGNMKEVSHAPKSQILFFERHEKRNIVTPLPIGPRGELPPDQPNSYREFFLKEQMDILGI